MKLKEIQEKLDNVVTYRPVIIRQLEIAVDKDFEKRNIKVIEIDNWCEQKWGNIIKNPQYMAALAHCNIIIDDVREVILKVARKKSIIVKGE